MRANYRKSLGGLVLTLGSLGFIPVWSLAADPAAPSEAALTIRTTAGGVRYGIWPRVPTEPAPTLFVLATTVEATLENEYYRQAGQFLTEAGVICVSVDLPCHGPELRPGEAEGLSGWRQRCDQNEDPIADLNTRLKAVLDELLAGGLVDPERIAACGTSRGGFAALHFAASEPRVRCVAAFAPVTDLTVLTEFSGAEANPLVQQLALQGHAGELSGRGVWLVIGDRDARVGTDHAIRFARAVTAASLAANQDAKVELHVFAEPMGHRTPPGSAALAAAWIEKQFAATP